MAKNAKAGDGVINLNNARNVVAKSVSAIVKLHEQRKKITAAINSERAQCKEAGVPTAALDLAIRMKQMDPEQRLAHDEGYILARQAIGLAIQPDLFAAMEKVPSEIEQAQAKHVADKVAAKPAGDTGATKPQPEPEVAKKNLTVAEAVAQAKEHLGSEKPNPFDDAGGAAAGTA